MENNYKKYFIDSSALIAAFYQKDFNHKRAIVISQKLKKTKGKTPIITDYILDETLTLLKRKIGYKETVKFGNLAFSSKSEIEVIYLSSKLIQQAWKLFVLYADKEFSFTDCTSFAIMQNLKIIQVFAFDKHFKQAGFEVIK